ncbi:MAG: transposase family protein [Tardiphaga sp.]|nr:transposase family protein [Tardiphaga sp.]
MSFLTKLGREKFCGRSVTLNKPGIAFAKCSGKLASPGRASVRATMRAAANAGAPACARAARAKTAFVTAARAAVRAATYLHAQFLRVKARRGPKKAIFAVAASMLTAVWHMLSDGVGYADLDGLL